MQMLIRGHGGDAIVVSPNQNTGPKQLSLRTQDPCNAHRSNAVQAQSSVSAAPPDEQHEHKQCNEKIYM